MAIRRQIGNLADTLLKYHMQSKQSEEEDQMIRERQAELSRQNAGQSVLEKVLSNPSLALKMKQAGMSSILGMPTDAFSADGSDLGKGQMDEIQKSTTPIPIEQLMAERQAAGPIITQTDKTGMSSLPDLQAFTGMINANQAHSSQLAQNEQDKIRNAGDQAEATSYGTASGVNNAANENLPDLIKRINTQTQGTEQTLGHSAYVQSMNQSRGQAEGQDPYTEGTVFYDPQGNAHMMRRSGGKLIDVALPPGYVGEATSNMSRPQKLSVTQVDNLAGLNTAEVEGVKVLKSMKDLGLDKINDMLDPRWQTFAATTLKINPGDWTQADDVQRTQFVKANLMRALMGGRGTNQFVAQIFADHMPDSKMAGQQLFHSMNNVLEQVGEKRSEIEHLTNNPDGKLAPSSGKTYQQYLQETGPDNPVTQPGGDPDIANFMQRPLR